MPPTNEELLQKAHDQELEGTESEALASQVVDFVTTQAATFSAALDQAQTQIDALTADQLPADQRDAISGSLDTAKASFDRMQEVLTALVTPPDQPVASKKKK